MLAGWGTSDVARARHGWAFDMNVLADEILNQIGKRIQVWYIWFASLRLSEVEAGILRLGYEPRYLLIWRKQRFVISRGHYHWEHEPCWYAVKKGETAGWIGDRKQTSVWDIANITDNYHNTYLPENERSGHSTQKPVECMERPIRNHEGDVYDPFVGSGTTIIAAERQGRACWAMELEPRYVDSSVKRWEDYTGSKAHRE